MYECLVRLLPYILSECVCERELCLRQVLCVRICVSLFVCVHVFLAGIIQSWILQKKRYHGRRYYRHEDDNGREYCSIEHNKNTDSCFSISLFIENHYYILIDVVRKLSFLLSPLFWV